MSGVKRKSSKTGSLRLGRKIRDLANKSIPLSLALLITLNSTLGIALIQSFFYKTHIDKLVSSLEKLDRELASTPQKQAERLRAEVFPQDGVVLPVKWGDVAKRLVDLGVIDQQKYETLFKGGPLSGENSEYDGILAGSYEGNIIVTKENSRFVLNTLWALGLSQQSTVLEDMRKQYPQVENLAATGGWTLAKGSAMDHYGRYQLLSLTSDQQDLVRKIASNIYRPCCDNHTAFPDCNHGMAMLGLVEMMVSEGYSENEIYDSALAVNSAWFPDVYVNIARFMENVGDISWSEVDSKEVLGMRFSSGSGYRSVLSQVGSVQGSGGGGGCGV